MDRATGIRILAALETLAPGFGELDSILSEMADSAERKEFKVGRSIERRQLRPCHDGRAPTS